MKTKELLLNSIILIYRESQINLRTSSLYKWVLESIKETESALGSDITQDTVKELKGILKYCTEQPEKEKLDRTTIISKIKLAVGNETYLQEIIEESLIDIGDQIAINQECVRIRKLIIDYRKKVEVVELTNNIAKDMKFNHALDVRHAAIELINKLQPMVLGGDFEIEGEVSSVSFDNVKSIVEQISKGQKSSSTEGILKTGWTGMNKMCGEEAGIRRGDLVCFGALQHNFKSGTLLSLAKHFCLYNKPYMLDSTKKPLIIFISLENNVEDNILLLYRSLKENETNEVVDIKSINPEEAAQYIKDKLTALGYHFELKRAEAGVFSYFSLMDMLNDYIAKGYEIHACIIDYLNLFSKAGCEGGTESAQIRDLFRKVRSFCNPKLITVVTAHQLSSEAKYLLRQGVDCFVKEVANKGYWDSCKTIDQELDLEIVQHISKPGDGRSYLELARGKHRKVTITAEQDLYYVQRFEPAGSLRDDINGKPLFMRRLGGGTGGDESSAEWWADAA